MISDKQLRANKENALLGGVKTPEGKETSKFNALTHGILRQSLTDYEEGFYVEIYDELVSQYQPCTLAEKILIERIAIIYLKLFRIQKAETEFMKAKLNPREVKRIDAMAQMTDKLFEYEVIKEGYIPQLAGDDIQRISDVYSRYEGMMENRLYRSLHELERLQNSHRIQDEANKMGSFGENKKK